MVGIVEVVRVPSQRVPMVKQECRVRVWVAARAAPSAASSRVPVVGPERRMSVWPSCRWTKSSMECRRAMGCTVRQGAQVRDPDVLAAARG